MHDFATLDEARQVIGESIERYNRLSLLDPARLPDPGRGPRELHQDGGVIRPPTCLRNRDRYTSSL